MPPHSRPASGRDTPCAESSGWTDPMPRSSRCEAYRKTLKALAKGGEPARRREAGCGSRRSAAGARVPAARHGQRPRWRATRAKCGSNRGSRRPRPAPPPDSLNSSPTRSGGVGLVLGAGNVASIPVLDVLYELLAHNRVVILKVNPTQDSLVPVFERVLAPLIEPGFLRIVRGGGDVGGYLTGHDGIDHVHITGAAATFDAIVWGTGARGRAASPGRPPAAEQADHRGARRGVADHRRPRPLDRRRPPLSRRAHRHDAAGEQRPQLHRRPGGDPQLRLGAARCVPRCPAVGVRRRRRSARSGTPAATRSSSAAASHYPDAERSGDAKPAADRGHRGSGCDRPGDHRVLRARARRRHARRKRPGVPRCGRSRTRTRRSPARSAPTC